MVPVSEEQRFRPRRTLAVHLVAVVIGVVAALNTPVATAADATPLTSFFSGGVTASSALLVAVALFHGALSDKVAFRVREWITPWSFLYLGIATVASLVGSVSTWSHEAWAVLFGLTAGPGAAALVTVVAMGWTNFNEQRKLEASERLRQLDPEKPK